MTAINKGIEGVGDCHMEIKIKLESFRVEGKSLKEVCRASFLHSLQ